MQPRRLSSAGGTGKQKEGGVGREFGYVVLVVRVALGRH